MKRKKEWIYCRFYDEHHKESPKYGWWVDTKVVHGGRVVYVVVQESDKEVTARTKIWIEDHNKTAHKL